MPDCTGGRLTRNHQKNNLLGMEVSGSADKVGTTSKNAHARVSEIAPKPVMGRNFELGLSGYATLTRPTLTVTLTLPPD